MEIFITQQPAQIGIKNTYPKMEMRLKPAEMEIRQTPPEIDIQIDYPQVRIDQKECRADIGYKPILAFETQHASLGQSAALKGIEMIARKGDALARSAGKGREIIGQIAWENTLNKLEVNVESIPHTPPRITFTGGLNIDLKYGSVDIVARPNLPEIDVVIGGVDIFLEQEPVIKIKTSGTYFDLVV